MDVVEKANLFLNRVGRDSQRLDYRSAKEGVKLIDELVKEFRKLRETAYRVPLLECEEENETQR